MFLLSLLLAITACSDPVKNGSISIHVIHEVGDQPLVTDTLCHVNEAGNKYLVNEVQWFLSNLELEDQQSHWTTLAATWYVDTDLPETTTLCIKEIPVGHYQSLHFTFGLCDTDNQSGSFPNPPESNMFWPDELGGGYHYMKLNGKYLTDDNLLAPLAIHLGRGQNEGLTEFYDNSFTVELPIDLTVVEGTGSIVGLVMNIDNWFRNPNTYDFNDFGSAIMQNQKAQQLLKENGTDVFSIKTNNDMESPLKTTVQLLHKAAPKPHFMTLENFKKTISNIKDSL